MSLQFWGENPQGNWTLTLRYRNNPFFPNTNVTMNSLILNFYGSERTPDSVARIPSRCHEDCGADAKCAGAGAESCDSCRSLRNASTLACVGECAPGMTARNGYCYNASLPEPVCPKESQCK